jgi:histidine ammonia-lyase
MIVLDGESLTIEEVYRIAVLQEKVSLSPGAVKRINDSRENLERQIRRGATIYGVNTGFGSLLNVKIDSEDIMELQRNLIRSHSSGVGSPLPREYVRAMMAIRLNGFCRGFSGVSEDLFKFALMMLNEGITPVVPRYGSVGASGDLAPLAHIALAIMGEGSVYYRDEVTDAHDLYRKLDLTP